MFYTDKPKGMTEATHEILLEMMNSGESERHSVADTLIGIASNGPDMATDERLIGNAKEVITSGLAFIADVQGRPNFAAPVFVQEFLQENEIGPKDSILGLALFLDGESENAATNHRNVVRSDEYRLMAIELRRMAREAHH